MARRIVSLAGVMSLNSYGDWVDLYVGGAPVVTESKGTRYSYQKGEYVPCKTFDVTGHSDVVGMCATGFRRAAGVRATRTPQHVRITLTPSSAMAAARRARRK